MAKITKNIILDFIRENNFVYYAKQNDILSRFLKIHFTASGAAVHITPGEKVVFTVTRADGVPVVSYGTIAEDCSATVEISNTALAIEGTATGEVTIISEAGEALSALNFIIEVEKTTRNDSALEASDTFPLFVKAIGELARVENEVQKNESARTAAEKSREEAEKTRELAELDRKALLDSLKSGAMAYTVLDASFPDKSIDVLSCTVDDTAMHAVYPDKTLEGGGVDGVDVLTGAIDNASADAFVSITLSGLNKYNIDPSVYKYASICYHYRGAVPVDGTESWRRNHVIITMNYTNGASISNIWGASLTSGWKQDIAFTWNDEAKWKDDYKKHILSSVTIKVCNNFAPSLYADGCQFSIANIVFYTHKPKVDESNTMAIANRNYDTTFTLDGVEGLEIGDEYSIHALTYAEVDENNPAFSIQTERAGKITAIDGNVITVSRQPINIYTFAKIGDGSASNYIDEDGYDAEINTFRILSKPDVGNRRIGATAYNFARSGRAHSKGAINMSEGGNAEGSYSFTSGKFCDAEYCGDAGGYNTKARGHHSITRGEGTIALRSNQAVLGQWNIPDLDAIFILGNGTGPGDDQRSNAFRVLADGSVEFYIKSYSSATGVKVIKIEDIAKAVGLI